MLQAGVTAGETALRDLADGACIARVPPDVIGAARRDAQFALALGALAAREALAEAPGVDPRDIGLVLASAKADLSGVADLGDGLGDGLGSPARLARRLAAELGLGGVTAAVSCACASGVAALSLAARRIVRGEAEHLLVVGVDVAHDFVQAGFASLGALQRGACRPFDARRHGMSLGDGAGAILLSAHAKESRGVSIAGWGGANDACHVTGPDREGAGLTLAVRRALQHAGIDASAIDLVHVHGTGTVANDACEARGLVAAFGGRTPPAFGTKAQTGHTLGAAGVLETLLACEALRRGVVSRNVGLEQPDVDAGLDLVREPRTLARSSCALKVSSGFGGIQAALVLQA